MSVLDGVEAMGYAMWEIEKEGDVWGGGGTC